MLFRQENHQASFIMAQKQTSLKCMGNFIANPAKVVLYITELDSSTKSANILLYGKICSLAKTAKYRFIVTSKLQQKHEARST